MAARGLGSFVVHRPRASHRLLALGGVGLGALVLGGAPLLGTYGSGKVVVPGVHFAVGGTGLVLASWWSDIFTAAGGDRLGGAPRLLPPIALEVSATWQHDAFLGERLLVAPGAELRRGRWHARASGLFSLDGTANGARVDVDLRPWSSPPPALRGAAHGRHNASSLALRAAIQYHDESEQGFALLDGELAITGRLELAHLDTGLRGTFVELDEGLGLELADYDHADAEVNTILITRFAWGVYLPRGKGEVSLFYDHRRDRLAGGLAAGRAAGFFGSLGVEGELLAARGWLVLGRVELGTSVLTTFGLRRELP